MNKPIAILIGEAGVGSRSRFIRCALDEPIVILVGDAGVDSRLRFISSALNKAPS